MENNGAYKRYYVATMKRRQWNDTTSPPGRNELTLLWRPHWLLAELSVINTACVRPASHLHNVLARHQQTTDHTRVWSPALNYAYTRAICHSHHTLCVSIDGSRNESTTSHAIIHQQHNTRQSEPHSHRSTNDAVLLLHWNEHVSSSRFMPQ